MTKADKRTTVSRSQLQFDVATPAGPVRKVISSYNYHNNAGQGSRTFGQPVDATWRGALLGTVAAGAMWMASARPALAACVTSGTDPVLVGCLNNTPSDPQISVDASGLGGGSPGAAGSGGTGVSITAEGGSVSSAVGNAINVVSNGGKGAGGDSASNGHGGAGGNGGAITVNSSATIDADNIGIYARADGGFGGNGVAGETGIGNGGNGGSGGPINITATGDIGGSTGIFAQGYGGSGGNGANGNSLFPDGGAGGRGGDGSSITISSTQGIVATVDGIYANSSGGHGGSGGGGGASFGPFNAQYGDGGDGGHGGDAAAITITNDGDITAARRGIAAFAFGGAGGYPGSGYYVNGTNGRKGSGGDIKIYNNGTIATSANYNSYGIQAAASDGGSVVIDNAGSITTDGNYAHGIMVGCGECGGTTGAVTITSSGDITVNGASAIGINVYGIAEAGPSTTVQITNSGTILQNTTAASSYAAGISVDRRTRNSIVTNVTVTNSGTISTKSASGIRALTNYGSVDVTNSGTISIIGTASRTVGIYAGTTGGGEGASTATVTNAATGVIVVTGDGGKGIVSSTYEARGYGDATVTNRGSVSVTGASTVGIASYGYDGTAIVNNSGSVAVSGAISRGVRAFTYGDVSLTNSGQITATGDRSTAVEVYSAGDVTITNSAGGLISGTGLYARAIDGYGSDSLVVNNAGTITGNVTLGTDGDPVAFNNQAGGLFNSGEFVSLGYFGTLTNDGTINVAGSGTVGTTTLTGNLVQNAGGTIGVDIDHVAGTSDLIAIDALSPVRAVAMRGPLFTASLAGTIAPNLVTFDAANVQKTFTILTAADGVTTNGLSVTDSALIDYTLLYPDVYTVQLTMRQLALNTDGLSPNEIAVAEYILNHQSDLPEGSGPVLAALFGAGDQSALSNILSQIYSNSAGSAAGGAMQSGRAFGVALRSCPVAEGPYGQQRETSCVWAKPEYRRFTQDSGIDIASVKDNTRGISGGFQTALAENVYGGLGGSIEESDSKLNGTTNTDSTLWQLGGVLKYVMGPWKLSGSLSGGHANSDTQRAINIPGLSVVASSGTEFETFSGLTRLSYSFGAEGFYVTPFVDGGFSHINIDGFTETGAGALNLTVGGLSKTIWSVSPGVEIGTTFAAEGLLLRPYVKAGVTFLSDDGFTTSAQFAGAPAGISPFRTTSKFDDVFADISAGVQMFSNTNVNLRLNYDGHFGDNSEQHGVDAKLTINY